MGIAHPFPTLDRVAQNHWIELHKINGHINQNTAQPIYIPPDMHHQPNAHDMNTQV